MGNEWRVNGSYILDVRIQYRKFSNEKEKVWYLVAHFLEPVKEIRWWSTKSGADPPEGFLLGKVWILKPECTWYFNQRNVNFNMHLVSDTSFTHKDKAMQFSYCY